MKKGTVGKTGKEGLVFGKFFFYVLSVHTKWHRFCLVFG